MTNHLSTTTGLPFVDHIYIATHPRLTDRHENLKRILNKHKITDYEWRMRWTYAACRNASNKNEIYRKLNLENRGELNIVDFTTFEYF